MTAAATSVPQKTFDRLILAEKHNMAQPIAEYLAAKSNTPIKRDRRAFIVGGDVVIAGDGHLLEDCYPEDYEPRFRNWEATIAELPYVPKRWLKKRRTDPTAREIFATLESYAPLARRVLHSGDYDREGQLIGDELCREFQIDVQVERLPIMGYDLDQIEDAFAAIHPNEEMAALSLSARTRGISDLIWGIALSRVYSVEATKQGYDGGISIGRVVSPTLHLLLRREQAIAKFQPITHFPIRARLDTSAGSLVAEWVPPANAAGAEGFDETGRLVRVATAEAIAARISRAKIAGVADVKNTTVKTQPPLPYALSTLYSAAFRVHRYTVEQVAEAAQALYASHHLITYPRSNCRYYPVRLAERAAATLAVIDRNLPGLRSLSQAADPTLRSGAFDDAKVAPGVASHYGIAPLKKIADMNRLTAVERDIYELICRNYIAHFYPPSIVERRAYTFKAHDTSQPAQDVDVLTASVSTLVDPGWYPVHDRSTEMANIELPVLEIGEAARIAFCLPDPEKTKAPRHYNDGSLISALNNVAKHVDDPDLALELGSGARLGTDATQSDIIKKLIDKKLVKRGNDGLTLTRIGTEVALKLPEELRSPRLSVKLEQELDKIARGSAKAGPFITSQNELVRAIVARPLQLQVADLWKPTSKKKSDDGGRTNGESSRS